MEKYNTDVMTMSREDMEKLQSERLVEEIKYVYETQKAYRAKMVY